MSFWYFYYCIHHIVMINIIISLHIPTYKKSRYLGEGTYISLLKKFPSQTFEPWPGNHQCLRFLNDAFDVGQGLWLLNLWTNLPQFLGKENGKTPYPPFKLPQKTLGTFFFCGFNLVGLKNFGTKWFHP